MTPFILTCLLSYVVCSALGVGGTEVTFSTELSGVTGGPASGEGLQSSLNDDDELELVEMEEDPLDGAHFSPDVFRTIKDERRKRKGKGKRKNRRMKSTTALNPEHMYHTSGYTSAFSSTTTEDPCTSTHLGFCIHGYCKYMEGLHEPVCVCMKGYDGERCGIQTLETKGTYDYENNTERVQMILVVIAVVLSVISCTAIILMTCAHYRSHKNFLASYLGSVGTTTEQEKLQKKPGDALV